MPGRRQHQLGLHPSRSKPRELAIAPVGSTARASHRMHGQGASSHCPHTWESITHLLQLAPLRGAVRRAGRGGFLAVRNAGLPLVLHLQSVRSGCGRIGRWSRSGQQRQRVRCAVQLTAGARGRVVVTAVVFVGVGAACVGGAAKATRCGCGAREVSFFLRPAAACTVGGPGPDRASRNGMGCWVLGDGYWPTV